MYFPIPLAGIAMVVFEIEAVYNHIKEYFCKGGDEIMSVQSMAIAVLLVSFLVMILLRFPIAYAVALSSILSAVAGTSADHDLSADGKRNQFLQSDGSAVLYHDGRA